MNQEKNNSIMQTEEYIDAIANIDRLKSELLKKNTIPNLDSEISTAEHAISESRTKLEATKNVVDSLKYERRNDFLIKSLRQNLREGEELVTKLKNERDKYYKIEEAEKAVAAMLFPVYNIYY